MTRDQAINVLHQWADVIGLGFHPDTAACEYEPPLVGTSYDRDMRLALRALGVDEFYEVALWSLVSRRLATKKGA